MTNTYNDDAPIEEKTLEEMRVLRCVLERLLMSLDPAGYTDYQFEKFSKTKKTFPEEKPPETVNALHFVPRSTDPHVGD